MKKDNYRFIPYFRHFALYKTFVEQGGCLSLMISPAASIRSIVILSGPCALPFLDCLTVDLTSLAFMLGKPSN